MKKKAGRSGSKTKKPLGYQAPNKVHKKSARRVKKTGAKILDQAPPAGPKYPIRPRPAIKGRMPKLSLDQYNSIRIRPRQASTKNVGLKIHLPRPVYDTGFGGPKKPLRPGPGDKPRILHKPRGGDPPPPPPSPCQQNTQVSFPTFQRDQVWSNWGIVDMVSTPGGLSFTPLLFQPTNIYEVTAVIQQTEAAGVTIRAVGTGWSFSDAAIPQPSPIPAWESLNIELTEALGSIWPTAWGLFGNTIDTSALNRSLQNVLPGLLLAGQNPGSLFFVEAGIKLSDLNTLLDSQVSRVALKTMGGSAGQSLAGAISTGTHGGDFDRAPLADSVRAIYLVGKGGIHHWIEPAAGITDPNEINQVFPCISVDNCHYDDTLFHAVQVSMGAMGVIYAVILDVVPQYALVQFNFKETWEGLVNAPFSNGLFDVFTTVLFGRLPFLQQFNINANNRFLQIVVNPIKNSNGTHSCYVSVRFEIPLTSLPAGINLPQGVQSANLSSLSSDQLNNMVGTAITQQPECGPVQAAVFFAAQELGTFNGTTATDSAQKLINFCKQYNYFWAVRAVIDAILQSSFPSDTVNPQVDVGFKVMAGGGVFSNNLEGQVVSAEAMFPFSSTQNPDALGFVNSMLATFDQGIPQNIFPAGYLSLRACGPTSATLGTEQFGVAGPFTSPTKVTGAVEMSLLRNGDSIGLIPQFEQLALHQSGNLHWGQSNGLMGAQDVQNRYSGLNAWNTAQAYFGGATFTNAFMTRCGLVNTGLPAGWIIILQDNSYWYSGGFPQDAATQIGDLVQAGYTFQHIRFAPDGSWILIGDSYYVWFGPGLAADLISAIDYGMQVNNNILVDVYFAPDGEWLIQWIIDAAGTRSYQPSAGFLAAVMVQVNQFDPGGAGQALLSIVFPPGGGWLAIFANNGYYASNIPDDTFAKLGELVAEGFSLLDVVFTAPDGWLVILGNNGYWVNGNFDQNIFSKVGELVTQNFTLLDIVIGIPALP